MVTKTVSTVKQKAFKATETNLFGTDMPNFKRFGKTDSFKEARPPNKICFDKKTGKTN